jgi:putative spermidine/putrescine transport system permease protein
MGGRLEPVAELIDPVRAGEVHVPGPERRAPRTARSRWGLAGLIGPPAAWMLLVYVGSLALLIATAFFTLDPIASEPTADLTLDNVRVAFTTRAYVEVVMKSVAVALAVTALCIVIALPMAFYIAKVAKARYRRALVVAAVLPLWAGYLVKGYAWKAMLRPASEFGVDQQGGFLDSVFGWTPGFGWTAVVLTLTHLWLPYMILPIYAGLERLPPSLLDASGDLGAAPLRTFRSVVMPMLLPSIAAGSVFTFSLSLGDFIIPKIVSEGQVRLIGSLIESTLLAPNQPLAAAFTLWPLLIILAYLVGMRRLGAFESL